MGWTRRWLKDEGPATFNPAHQDFGEAGMSLLADRWLTNPSRFRLANNFLLQFGKGTIPDCTAANQ